MQRVEIPIREASFPEPYEHTLEFNPPVHETWNIVHIGMNIPECQQIYVCAINCMRGVVLTAAEMNRADRFSFVILKEEDMVEGTVEDITIEGVADVIRKLPVRPKAVCLFTVCTHLFLGCDQNRIYRILEGEFPDITFIHGHMEPILQKDTLSPDQMLRIDMTTPLSDSGAVHDENRRRKAALISSNVPLAESSDISRVLNQAQVDFVQMSETNTFEEYRRLGEADLFLAVVPNGRLPVERTGERLKKKALYLPLSFSYEEIRQQEEELMDWCGITIDRTQWFQGEEELCEAALEKAKRTIGDTPIWIDYVVHPRPLGLARLLLEHGFRVEKIFLNAFNGEEEDAYDWLKQYAPELLISSTIQPLNRVMKRGTEEKLLAIGPQAAWFGATPWFVNMVEGGDLQGFDGIRRMAELMEEAWKTEKDTRDLVPRKGLGCESCV